MMSKSFEKYMEQIQFSMTNNLKKFWNFVKNKQKSNILPSNITDGDVVLTIWMTLWICLKSELFESVYNHGNINVTIRILNSVVVSLL